jgi:hypothetical protein
VEEEEEEEEEDEQEDAEEEEEDAAAAAEDEVEEEEEEDAASLRDLSAAVASALMARSESNTERRRDATAALSSPTMAAAALRHKWRMSSHAGGQRRSGRASPRCSHSAIVVPLAAAHLSRSPLRADERRHAAMGDTARADQGGGERGCGRKRFRKKKNAKA